MSDLNSPTPTTAITAAPQEPTAQLPATAPLFSTICTMDDAARLCKALASSKMTPAAFKNDHGAILMALNVSQTLKCDLFMVMQNMYEVHGRMGFSGQFCISALNRCPQYARIEYRYLNARDWTAGIQVIGHRKDGLQDVGTPITPDMVKGEGWDKNSKWRTMPEQMYKYRAASFFVRTFCPDALMGFQTTDEIHDLVANGTYKPEPRNVTPRSKLAPAPQQETIPATIVDEEADLLDLD